MSGIGYLKVLCVLLSSKKLDVHDRNADHDTALSVASLFNKVNIVRELINYNNIDVNHANGLVGETVMYFACDKNHFDIVRRELLKHPNIDVNVPVRYVGTCGRQ